MITVATPIDFPIVTVSEQDLQVVSDEISHFIKAIRECDGIDSGKEIKDLIISSRILNGAISQSEYLRGHAQVIMKENELIFQTSLPMDFFPGGKHRYFVSTMDTSTATTGPSITTTTYDLDKELSQNYDGPLFVMELLSYLTSTTTGNDQEWVISVLRMNLLGFALTTTDILEAEVETFQTVSDDPKNNQLDLISERSFQFYHIEKDQMIVRADVFHTKMKSFEAENNKLQSCLGSS